MHTGKTKIVHSENLRHRDSNDIWDRTYSSIRQPVQVSNLPDEQPTRHQPLRAARLPYSDQAWYGDFTQIAPMHDTSPSKVTETQVAPENTSPLRPSAATASPAVFSPHSPESGEHGQLTPLSQRNTDTPTPRYALRSQGPVADPVDASLEGYRYRTNRERYVPKRPRDPSHERTEDDKRPRIQYETDCLSMQGQQTPMSLHTSRHLVR